MIAVHCGRSPGHSEKALLDLRKTTDKSITTIIYSHGHRDHISGRQVSRFLSQLIEQRGAPKKIICDNGTEFTSKAMFFWSKETSVQLGFIQPRKPTQNAFVESLNGKFRNECLNQRWFRTLDEAKYEIDLWREHYNKVRPHSALGYVSPEEFTRQAA